MTRWFGLLALTIASAIVSYVVAGALVEDRGPPARSSSRSTAPRQDAARSMAERLRAPRVRMSSLDLAQAATLDEALASALSDDESVRWYDGLHLVTSLRIYQFSFDGCSVAAHAATLRVQWQAHSSPDGLRFEAPRVLTALPTTLDDCARAALAGGMRVDAVELGGPLAELTVPVVLEVPTTLTPELRAHVDALDAMVTERRTRGLPANARADAAPAP